MIEKVMWDWTVRSCSFEGSVEAAAAGDFSHLSYPWRKYRAELARGRSIEMLSEIAGQSGVALDILDGFTGWAPQRFPAGTEQIVREAFDFSDDEAIELCLRAGFKSILAFGGFDPGSFSTAQLIESFGRFCDKAAKNDIQVFLEPIVPLGGLRTLAEVWAVVHGADRPNGSIILDSWHFMRGGADFALLGALPRGAIRHVQLTDGVMKQPTDILNDSDHHRELPGYGEMPLPRLMSVLLRTQDIESVGPEAKSDRVDRLVPLAIGRQAGQAIDALLSHARKQKAQTS